MANFKYAFDLQKAVADALGLDVSQLTRIVIDMPCDGPPRARISMYLSPEQCDALTRTFEATSFTETPPRPGPNVSISSGIKSVGWNGGVSD